MTFLGGLAIGASLGAVCGFMFFLLVVKDFGGRS